MPGFETAGEEKPKKPETYEEILKRLEEESKKRPSEGIDHFKDRPNIVFDDPKPSRGGRGRRRRASGNKIIPGTTWAGRVGDEIDEAERRAEGL